MNISIVIPNYNGEEIIRDNLPRVINETKKYKLGEVEIIVVDDKSTDNSLEVLNILKKNYANLRILENERNLGFSSTVNKGVLAATGEVVVLLNTDVYPQNNFLDPLLIHFKDERVFAVGCLDKSVEGDKIIERGRGLGRWSRGFLIHKRGEVNKTNTLWVSGGSGAFRKIIWTKLRGLNELYNPFYWEDIDLSYRALKSGYIIKFEPKSVVVHEHSRGIIKSKYSPFRIKTISYRNQFIFSWENATDYSLLFSHLFWLPYHFIKALFRFDTAFFIGFFSALILLPKIIVSKLNYTKTFVKKDMEVIREIG